MLDVRVMNFFRTQHAPGSYLWPTARNLFRLLPFLAVGGLGVVYLHMQTALEFYERLSEFWVPDINLHSEQRGGGGEVWVVRHCVSKTPQSITAIRLRLPQ